MTTAVTVGTQSTIAEQRRSRRYRQSIAVDLVDKRGSRRALTVDVARHGLFVAIADPPRNRHLVQLTIHLPDGSLQAAATVARVLPGQGVGLALFALSADAKRRWDAFILAAAQKEPVGSGPIPSMPPAASPAGSSMAPVAAPQLPSFIVRLKSLDRLREYQQNHVAVGGTVLFTPVLPPAGASVQLIVVHPLTYAEYPLYGQIHRAIAEAPKRLEILFVDVDAEGFHRFVETGRPPSRPPTPVSTPPRAAAEPELELEIDVDDGAMMQEEPVEWDLRCEIGAVLDEIKDDDDDEATLRGPRPATSTTLGFSIDSADSAIFEHGDDDGEELLIDDTMAAVDPGLRPTAYRLGCDAPSCTSEPYHLELGPCAGVLGLVADQQPFWSPASGRVVSVPRLLPADARRARFVRYLDGGGSLSDVVNLAVFLAAADLAESPRHPVTAEPLKSTRAIERLAATARRVGEAPATTKVRCPACEGGHLVISRA